MAKEYARNEAWRKRFADLVTDARCVITAPDKWPELCFEFGMIRDLGAPRKLFIFTPPAGLQWTRLVSLLLGPRPLTWAEYVEALDGVLGYQLGKDPGPGAVVTFDDEGRADVLAQGVTKPEGYISVVRDDLSGERPHPGQH